MLRSYQAHSEAFYWTRGKDRLCSNAIGGCNHLSLELVFYWLFVQGRFGATVKRGSLSLKQQAQRLNEKRRRSYTFILFVWLFISLYFNMFVTDIRKEFYDVVVNQVSNVFARLCVWLLAAYWVLTMILFLSHFNVFIIAFMATCMY